MTTYLRSLFEGSFNANKRRPSSFHDSKSRRRSCSCAGSETSSTVLPVGYGSVTKRNSVSGTPCPPRDLSHASLPTQKKHPHHHHHRHHDSAERLTLIHEHDASQTPYPIYIPIESSHPSRESSTDSSTPTPPSKPTTSVIHPEPRPALKKERSTWQAGSHPRTQHHVSFANPYIPDVLHMHPLLAASRLNRAPISYDVTFAPSSTSIVDRRTRTSIPTHTLSQPATDPAKSNKLVLRCDRFPWPVIVYPSQRPGAITNLDLLAAVYSTLSAQVTHDEWDALGHGTHAQLKAAKAYEVRCAKVGGGWDDGVRRIDWLGEKTCLVGVEVDKSVSECGVGKLVFAKP
ncbi:uncharacterized protein EV420DRAFT_1654078 [Desarmillaria tabescens]|uniref:DUF6699 domain-containing protein n=1 Tax=Armillaria tabescens TaxID=1929756 RepID=A0AA39J1C0_ARMTA|nr:uncharacterized protein EV420DRAFT_1654078 [Desarmillaria tabescens]KAK0434273.1 hypothetical protein EV420DRAFT_1654078 [Desarmillaria tabescens]